MAVDVGEADIAAGVAEGELAGPRFLNMKLSCSNGSAIPAGSMKDADPVAPSSAPRSGTSGLAIGSLVTGLTCLAPAAVVLGHIALSRMKRTGGQPGGRGLAIAGLILGYLGLASYFVLIPMLFVAARAWDRGADRAQCLLNQRQIEHAVRAYQMENNLSPGDPLDIEAVFASQALTEAARSCPSGGQYHFSETVPPTGGLIVICPHADELDHAPADPTGL